MRSVIAALVAVSTLVVSGCTADATEGHEPAQENKPNPAAEAKPTIGTEMKPQCMVNDEGTEAICCGKTDCWYVDLRRRDPYSYR